MTHQTAPGQRDDRLLRAIDQLFETLDDERSRAEEKEWEGGQAHAESLQRRLGLVFHDLGLAEIQLVTLARLWSEPRWCRPHDAAWRARRASRFDSPSNVVVAVLFGDVDGKFLPADGDRAKKGVAGS
jgi:hypothetical protein